MPRMGRASEGRWQQRVLELATFLAEEALSIDLFPRFLEMLARDFPGSSALLDYDADQRRLEFAGWGVDASARRAYSEHFHAINPFTKSILAHRLYNHTYVGSRFIDQHAFPSTEFYNDWLRPRGERYLLVLSIGFDDGGRTGLPIYRGEAEGGEFTSEDARRLDMLRSFLKSTLLLRRLFRQQRLGWTESIDPRGLPLAVIADLNDQFNTNNADERLLTANAFDHIKRQGPPQPLVHRSPVAASCFLERSKLIFTRRYGLSPREAEVASLLCDGLSYEETATRLDISYHTVNAHVKTLLRKLNLSSTRHLPRLLREETMRR